MSAYDPADENNLSRLLAPINHGFKHNEKTYKLAYQGLTHRNETSD